MRYLLLSLAAVAIFATGAAAKSYTDRVHVVRQVDTGNAIVNGIISTAQTVMCPDIEERAGMTPGACRVRPGSLITIKVGDPEDPGSTHQVTLEVPLRGVLTYSVQ